MGARGDVMSNVIHVRDETLIRAVEEGAEYLVIGRRRFRLIEVPNGAEEPHDVTDPEEVALIEKALRDTRPPLSADQARAYVQDRLKKHDAG